MNWSIQLIWMVFSLFNFAISKEALTFESPKIPDSAYYTMYFSGNSRLENQMILSDVRVDGKRKYDGQWSLEVPSSCPISGDHAIVMTQASKHYAIAGKFRRPFRFDKKDELVVQYEVKFTKELQCGGAYIKLLTYSPNLDLKELNDNTPYTIMFGPDKCGTNLKIHFIYRIKNPITGEWEEHHGPPQEKKDIELSFKNKKTHLYTLVLRSDNSFVIYLDQWKLSSGSMITGVRPPIKADKEIPDPEDKKPADWDDRPEIEDPSAKKPADWPEELIIDGSAKMPEGWLVDAPQKIPDPSAKMPAEWNSAKQGKWTPPLIDNPKCNPGCGKWQPSKIKNPLYKGKWKAPMISNPNYRGQWTPRMIPNPHYDKIMNPFRSLAPVSAIALELWTVTEGAVFDNFLVIDSKEEADKFAESTWAFKAEEETRADPNSQSVVDAVRFACEERPWLWIVIILSFVVPIGLFLWWLFTPSKDYANFRRVPAFVHRDFEQEKKDKEEYFDKTRQQHSSQSLTSDTNKGDDPAGQNGGSLNKEKADVEDNEKGSTVRKRTAKS